MATPSATLQELVAETGWLRRLARTLVKDAAAADDLVQDTYVVAATEAPTDGRPIRPWLARVLWNRVRMRSRGANRRRAREEVFAGLAAPPAQPDDIVDRIKIQRMLAGLVLELAPPLRDVLLLHYFEGLTSSQIGARLGIAPGTVRWRLKQAIDELRDRLEQRSPNHAWVAPMAGFAGKSSASAIPIIPVLLAAAFIALAIFAVVLHSEVRSVDNGTSCHVVAHASVRPELPTEEDSRESTFEARVAVGRGPDQGFGSDHRRIAGTVIDQAGQRVEGADVEVDCGYDDGAASPTRRTDANGAFAFDIDPQCRYTVTATKGRARGTSLWFQRSEGREMTIQVVRGTQARIRVLDAEAGTPLPGAEVTVSTMMALGTTSAVTASDGIAELDTLLPTHFTICAAGHACVGGELEDPAHPGEHARFADWPITPEIHREVRLSAGVAVAGVVLGPDGAVPGASVELVGPFATPVVVRTTAKTDANGRFEARLPGPGRYSLSAARRDLATAGEVVVSVPIEGTTSAVAHVVRRGEIHGTVVDLGFRAVPGARVSVGYGRLRPVIADRNGRFTIENVDGEVDLIAQRGADSSAFQHLELGAASRAEVVLQIGSTGISGVAVDNNGAPVGGAYVWLNSSTPTRLLDDGTGVGVKTDASGKFAFDVPRGNFVLSVKRDFDDDYEDDDDVNVAGGSHDVRVVVP